MITWIIRILGLSGLFFTSLGVIAALETNDPVARAILGMGAGLIVIWVLIGGSLMYRFRESVKRRVLTISWHWQVKFVLFCIILALLEEAVTVSLTNLAPLFGVLVGAAYITASADYLDVVLFHSVIVFVPQFIVWAWLLKRYNFSPATVFLLYGLTGTLGEALAFGAESLVRVGFWLFVYGLMVYLPAYSLPDTKVRGAHPAHWYHGVLAIVAAFVVSIPVVILVNTIHPVSIHFPPIGG